MKVNTLQKYAEFDGIKNDIKVSPEEQEEIDRTFETFRYLMNNHYGDNDLENALIFQARHGTTLVDSLYRKSEFEGLNNK